MAVSSTTSCGNCWPLSPPTMNLPPFPLAPQVLTLADAAATHGLGVWLGQRLPAGTTLLLQGDLGSGKTALVKGIGAGLGLTEEVDSPTFTLLNEYLGGRVPLYHGDLYRLEDPKAIAALGLEAYWEGIEFPPGILALEWADRLPASPPHPLTLALSILETGRQIVLFPSTLAQATLLADLTPGLEDNQPTPFTTPKG